MAKIEHNDTYIQLRVLQIICAMIITGQTVCIYLSTSCNGPSIQVPKQIQMLLVFTLVLGTTSIITPFSWLCFQTMTKRFPKLVWLELGIDFQFGISWFLMFMMQAHGNGVKTSSAESSSSRDAVERLWTICQTFMLFSGTVWLTNGILNCQQVWRECRRPAPDDQQVLLEEHEFASRSLRSKPSRSSTTQSSPNNSNIVPVEPGPSIIHWRPVSPPYDVETRELPVDGAMTGRAL